MVDAAGKVKGGAVGNPEAPPAIGEDCMSSPVVEASGVDGIGGTLFVGFD